MINWLGGAAASQDRHLTWRYFIAEALRRIRPKLGGPSSKLTIPGTSAQELVVSSPRLNKVPDDIAFFITAYRAMKQLETKHPTIANTILHTMMCFRFKNASRPAFPEACVSKHPPGLFDQKTQSIFSHYFRSSLDTHEKLIKQYWGIDTIESTTHTPFTLIAHQKVVHFAKMNAVRVKVNSLDSLSTLLPLTPQDDATSNGQRASFYDATPLFLSATAENITEIIQQVKNKITQNTALQHQTIIATVTLHGQQWLIELSASPTGYFRTLRDHKGIHHDIFGSFDAMIDPSKPPSQNAEAFCRLLGIDLGTLLEGTPAINATDPDTIQLQKSHLSKKRDEIASHPSVHARLVGGMISGVLAHLDLDDTKSYIDNDTAASLVANQLKMMTQRLNALTEAETDAQKIHAFELFAEEVWATLALLPRNPDASLETAVRNWAGDKNQTITAHPFAMTSLSIIFDALRKTSKDTVPLALGLASDTYYGVRADQYDNAFTETHLDALNLDTHPRVDVLVVDLYPNEVTQPAVHAHDIASMIRRQLRLRGDGQVSSCPLTVVIDTTATVIGKTEIDALYQEFKGDIESGNVILIQFSSLAKLAQLGLDRSSGGVIQTVGKMDDPFYSILSAHIKKRETTMPLSPLAQDYFSFLFTFCRGDIEQYIDCVLATTNRVYDQLKMPQDSVLRVQPRDNKIPMIGIQTNWLISDDAKANLFVVLEHYLMHRCMETPLNTRVSWGFMHVNINDAWTALRITFGLDSEDTQKRIIEEIMQLNAELNDMNPEDPLLKTILNPPSIYEALEQNPLLLDRLYHTTPPMDLKTFLHSLIEGLQRRDHLPSST